MTVKEVTGSVFGKEVRGIEVVMSIEEARHVQEFLAQGFAFPPTIAGGNVNYAARETVLPLAKSLRAITESR